MQRRWNSQGRPWPTGRRSSTSPPKTFTTTAWWTWTTSFRGWTLISATTLKGGRGRLRLQELQLRDQLVGDDLLHGPHGRLEQLRPLHLLRVEPFSLGVRAGTSPAARHIRYTKV